MYGRPISSLPAQMICWMAAGTPSGAAARPSTKRAVLPGTSSSGRTVGPVAEVMPLPVINSLGTLVAAGSTDVATLPPVVLAAVPVVVLAFVGATKGTTAPVAVFS